MIGSVILNMDTTFRWKRRAAVAALLGTLLAATVPARAATTPAATSGQPVIVVLGDSLSAEYGCRATPAGWHCCGNGSRPRRPSESIIASRTPASAATPRAAAARLPAVLQRLASIVVVGPGRTMLRGVPLATTEQNLRDIIAGARQARAKVVLVGMCHPITAPTTRRSSTPSIRGCRRISACPSCRSCWHREQAGVVPGRPDAPGTTGARHSARQRLACAEAAARQAARLTLPPLCRTKPRMKRAFVACETMLSCRRPATGWPSSRTASPSSGHVGGQIRFLRSARRPAPSAAARRRLLRIDRRTRDHRVHAVDRIAVRAEIDTDVRRQRSHRPCTRRSVQPASGPATACATPSARPRTRRPTSTSAVRQASPRRPSSRARSLFGHDLLAHDVLIASSAGTAAGL